jgi:hypothetical protein
VTFWDIAGCDKNFFWILFFITVGAAALASLNEEEKKVPEGKVS